MHQLAQVFAVEVHAYVVMSNHFHLVVYYDPQACTRWSDEEVADRWLRACPPPVARGGDDATAALRHTLLANSQRLDHVRTQLGSLSMFMKLLKQPIARRANLEDHCTGHFFEQRFYCAALLDEAAVIATMAYVDMNPIRAKIADRIEQAGHTSITRRLKADPLDAVMMPVVSGLARDTVDIELTLADYLGRLHALNSTSSKQSRWQQQVALLKKKQRVFGSIKLIQQWIEHRGMQLRETPLP